MDDHSSDAFSTGDPLMANTLSEIRPLHSQQSEREQASDSDINLKIFFPFIAYAQDHFGRDALEELLENAGIDKSSIDTPNIWISIDQANGFLEGVYAVLDSDETAFREAAVYRMKESYGPLRFLFRAISPRLVYDLAQKHFSAISKIARGEHVPLSRSRALLKVWSTKKENRLMCISRQAQSAALPSLWGLPHAHLKEKKCMCLGDDRCEYEIHVYQTKSWIPVLLGATMGAVISGGLYFAQLFPSLANYIGLFLPLIGLLFGYAVSLRRMNAQNFNTSEEINDELRNVIRENVAVNLEIEGANRRQREWSRLMEEQVSERTLALEKVVSDIEHMQSEHTSQIRGYSHDLKNPFFTVTMITEELSALRDKLSDDARLLVTEQQEAVTRMKRMLDELVTAATRKNSLMQFSSERIEVSPLVDILRKRLQAFVHGKDIRVSVFSNREAPASIETDRLLFDRVVDNLLTNAAKYTEQGSIVVELDGKPDFLTIKVSDTGRGIDDEDIERIFLPGASNGENREGWSHGVGLSVVVRLLAQIGGNLEVISLPEKGTTFWAHFPVGSRTEEDREMQKPKISRLTPQDLFLRVVKVRKSNSA